MSCFMVQQKHRCFSNPLVGLVISESGHATLHPDIFSCCSDPQEHLQEDGSWFICSARKRLSRVQDLLDQYKRLWKQPFPGFPRAAQPRIQEYFHAMICLEKGLLKGSVFCSDSDQTRGSDDIWLMAMVSVWRYDFHPHVVTIGLSREDELLPHLGTGCGQYRPIVLVDQVKSFRFPHFRQDFELLVSWADRAEAPLWMDVIREVFDPPPKETSSDALLSAYNKRISRFRKTPPLAHLDSNTLSRLSSVSVGYRNFHSP
ncbi:MAG: hypothetical protein H6618_10295 [Deltaproteobacteria bacterium]|nr:hypothetical protein [Deltaproteobacteria bacterium]